MKKAANVEANGTVPAHRRSRPPPPTSMLLGDVHLEVALRDTSCRTRPRTSSCSTSPSSATTRWRAPSARQRVAVGLAGRHLVTDLVRRERRRAAPPRVRARPLGRLRERRADHVVAACHRARRSRGSAISGGQRPCRASPPCPRPPDTPRPFDRPGDDHGRAGPVASPRLRQGACRSPAMSWPSIDDRRVAPNAAARLLVGLDHPTDSSVGPRCPSRLTSTIAVRFASL